jgi:hypothetical protein
LPGVVMNRSSLLRQPGKDQKFVEIGFANQVATVGLFPKKHILKKIFVIDCMGFEEAVDRLATEIGLRLAIKKRDEIS